MKMFNLSILSILLVVAIFGQSSKPAGTLVSLAKIQAGGQGIGFAYEPVLSKKFTIDLCAGVGGAYSIAEASLDYDVLKPAVYLSVTPKFFYNIAKRASAGKNTELNSGNYFGVSFKYNRPFNRSDDLVRSCYLTNIHWGIQRALGEHFIFNAHAGLGYAQDIPTRFGTIYPSLDFRFSYAF